MAVEDSEFVDYANPHSWFLVSDNLHTQATAIYGTGGDSFITRSRAGGIVEVRYDQSHKSAFLLAGFALENAIKGFLVYENPSWVANGRLSKHLRSHSLTKLQAKSKLIPYPIKYRSVLEGFEDGLESWARYPCALTAAETKEEAVLSDRMWAGYMILMRSYGNKMIRLLSAGWKGPHGWHGRFEIKKGFFSMCD